jgi:hypothetical protein
VAAVLDLGNIAELSVPLITEEYWVRQASVGLVSCADPPKVSGDPAQFPHSDTDTNNFPLENRDFRRFGLATLPKGRQFDEVTFASYFWQRFQFSEADSGPKLARIGTSPISG